MNYLKKFSEGAKTVFGIKPPKALIAQKEAMDQAMRIKAQPKRILMADDDNLSIELFEFSTKEYRYELVAKNTVSETIAFLEASEPLAAAILDTIFMNGDGIHVYRWIAKNRPGLSVAFLTSFKNPALVDLIQQVGPARVFDKQKLGEPGFVDQLMLQLSVPRKTAFLDSYSKPPFPDGPAPSSPESR